MSTKEPIHLFIQMEESELVKQLRRENKDLRELLAAERLRLNKIEMDYGAEVNLNNELVDLLKEHEIPFRPVLEHVYRQGRKK